MSDDKISLTLETREVTGKAVKHLRSNGTVPAVIHDHGKDSIIVQGNYVAVLKVWQQAGKHHPVNLSTGDKNYTALIKSVDFDPKKQQLRHVVFNAVDRNQTVEAEVPIHAHYDEGNDSSPAERNGLIVLAHLDTVQVKAVASKLPDFLEYDAEKLVEIGDSITVADLNVPADVEIVTEAEHSVASVYEPSALQAANEAAAGDAEATTDSETVSESDNATAEGSGAGSESADKSE